MKHLSSILTILYRKSSHSAAHYLVMLLALVLIVFSLTPLLRFHSDGVVVETTESSEGLGQLIQAVMVIAVAIMVGRALTVRPARIMRRRRLAAAPIEVVPAAIQPVRVSRSTAVEYSAAAR